MNKYAFALLAIAMMLCAGAFVAVQADAADDDEYVNSVLNFDYDSEVFEVSIDGVPANDVKILNFDEDITFDVVKGELTAWDAEKKVYFDAYAKFGIAIVVIDELGNTVYTQTAENDDGTTEAVKEFTFTLPKQLGDRYGHYDDVVGAAGVGSDSWLKVQVVLSNVDVELRYVVTGSGQFYSTDVKVMSGPAVPFECYPEGEGFEDFYIATESQSTDVEDFYVLGYDNGARAAFFNIVPTHAKLLAVIYYNYLVTDVDAVCFEGTTLNVTGQMVEKMATQDLEDYGDADWTFIGMKGVTFTPSSTDEEAYEGAVFHMDIWKDGELFHTQEGFEPKTYNPAEIGGEEVVVETYYTYPVIAGDNIAEQVAIDEENSFAKVGDAAYIYYDIDAGYLLDDAEVTDADGNGLVWDFGLGNVIVADLDGAAIGPVTIFNVTVKDVEYDVIVVLNDYDTGLYEVKDVTEDNGEYPLAAVKYGESVKFTVVAPNAISKDDVDVADYLGTTVAAYVVFDGDVVAIPGTFKVSEVKAGASVFTLDVTDYLVAGETIYVYLAPSYVANYLDADRNAIAVPNEFKYFPMDALSDEIAYAAYLPTEADLEALGIETPELKVFAGWFDGITVFAPGAAIDYALDYNVINNTVTFRAIYQNNFQTIILLLGDNAASVDVDPATGLVITPMPDVKKAGMHPIGYWTYAPFIKKTVDDGFGYGSDYYEGQTYLSADDIVYSEEIITHGVKVLNADGSFAADNIVVGEDEFGVDAQVYVVDGKWFARIIDDMGVTVYLDVELYAVFEGDDLILTLDKNFPEPELETEELEMKGGEIVVPENPFENPGYEFVGWDVDGDGEVDVVPGDSYILDGDTTFYAVWEAVMYTVTAMSEFDAALFTHVVDEFQLTEIDAVAADDYLDEAAVGGKSYTFTVDLSPDAYQYEVGYFVNGEYTVLEADDNGQYVIDIIEGDTVLYVSENVATVSYTCDGEIFTEIKNGKMYITAEFYPDDVYVYNLATSNINPANAIVLMKIITVSGFDEDGSAITAEEIRYESMQFMEGDGTSSWAMGTAGQSTGLISTAAVKIPAGDDLVSVDIDIYMPLADGTVDHFATKTVDMTQIEVEITYYERVNTADPGADPIYEYILMEDPAAETVIVNTFETGLRFGAVFADPEIDGFDLVGYYVAPEDMADFDNTVQKRLTPYTAVSGDLSAICILERVTSYLAVDLMGGESDGFSLLQQDAVRIVGDYDADKGTTSFEFAVTDDSVDPAVTTKYIATVATDANGILLDNDGNIITCEITSDVEVNATAVVKGETDKIEIILLVGTGIDSVTITVDGSQITNDEIDAIHLIDARMIVFEGVINAIHDGVVDFNTPTKDGYVFDGFYFGGEQVIAPDMSVAEIPGFFEMDADGAFVWAYGQDAVLEAGWTDEVTVTFVDYDGTVVGEKVYKINALAEQFKEFPSRNGYTFVAYCEETTDDDGNVIGNADKMVVDPNAAWNADNEDVVIVANDTDNFDKFVYAGSSVLELMAVWTPNAYNIWTVTPASTTYTVSGAVSGVVDNPDNWTLTDDNGVVYTYAAGDEEITLTVDDGTDVATYTGTASDSLVNDADDTDVLSLTITEEENAAGSARLEEVTQDAEVDPVEVADAGDGFFVGYFTKPEGGVMVFDAEGNPCAVAGITDVSSKEVDTGEVDENNEPIMETQSMIIYVAGKDITVYPQFDNKTKVIFQDVNGDVIDIAVYEYGQVMTDVVPPVITAEDKTLVGYTEDPEADPVENVWTAATTDDSTGDAVDAAWADSSWNYAVQELVLTAVWDSKEAEGAALTYEVTYIYGFKNDGKPNYATAKFWQDLGAENDAANAVPGLATLLAKPEIKGDYAASVEVDVTTLDEFLALIFADDATMEGYYYTGAFEGAELACGIDGIWADGYIEDGVWTAGDKTFKIGLSNVYTVVMWENGNWLGNLDVVYGQAPASVGVLSKDGFVFAGFFIPVDTMDTPVIALDGSFIADVSDAEDNVIIDEDGLWKYKQNLDVYVNWISLNASA